MKEDLRIWESHKKYEKELSEKRIAELNNVFENLLNNQIKEGDFLEIIKSIEGRMSEIYDPNLYRSQISEEETKTVNDFKEALEHLGKFRDV